MPILCQDHLKCPKVETLSYGGDAASIREDFGSAAPASIFPTSPARSVAQVQIGVRSVVKQKWAPLSSELMKSPLRFLRICHAVWQRFVAA